MTADLRLGDCVEVMAGLEAGSVDAVVCDPPYGLEFMGKEWDRLDPYRRGNPSLTSEARDGAVERKPGGEFGERIGVGYGVPKRIPRCRNCGKQKHNHPKSRCSCPVPDWDLEGYHHNYAMQQWHEAWAREAYRVLKPGGHLLAFGGTRTYHRLACAVEDAGFEIRDTIAWLYGSGFPKSLDVGKAIDRQAGAEREVVGPDPNHRARVHSEAVYDGGQSRPEFLTAPATADARRWQGWGTALKPAHEPIVVARKPLCGTVAGNVLAHGVGALNVDGCRIGTGEDKGVWPITDRRHADVTYTLQPVETDTSQGRWPANVVLDGEAARLLDEQAPNTGGGGFCGGGIGDGNVYGAPGSGQTRLTGRIDANGGASRFFYVAKSSRAERNAGLDGFERQDSGAMVARARGGLGNPRCVKCGHWRGSGSPCVCADPEWEWPNDGQAERIANHHPTVKPIHLMRWLVRLVTPPGGLILDPFLGSGTTGAAAALEGFRFLGIEREPDYLQIARARIAFWAEHGEDGLELVRARDEADAKRDAIAQTGQLDLLTEGAA